jgi:hypothetical protein
MVDLRKKLRSGMIAVTPAGSYLVLTDCETANYGSQDFCVIGPDGFMIGSNYDENLSTILGICSIKALYRSTVNGLTYEMKYKDKDLIWTRDPKNLKELIISRRFSR